MAVFDSYSSRSGEIFFNEIYKSSKQINSQKTSQSILFMCRAKFGTDQLKSLKIPSMFSKIYRYFWRFSTTGKAAFKLHLQRRFDKQAAKHHGFECLIPGVASMTLWLSWSEHLSE